MDLARYPSSSSENCFQVCTYYIYIITASTTDYKNNQLTGSVRGNATSITAFLRSITVFLSIKVSNGLKLHFLDPKFWQVLFLFSRFFLPCSSSVISEDPFSPAPWSAAWLLVRNPHFSQQTFSFRNLRDKFNFMPGLGLCYSWMWIFLFRVICVFI